MATKRKEQFKVNVYLSNETRKEMKNCSRHYKVSWCTIINTIYNWVGIIAKESPDLYNEMKQEYLYEGKKTSTNLNFQFKEREKDILTNKFISNCINLYFDPKKKYKAKGKLKEVVIKQLQETEDSYYMFNDTLRQMHRIARQHPESLTKILQDEGYKIEKVK